MLGSNARSVDEGKDGPATVLRSSFTTGGAEGGNRLPK
ncbi:MAG: hypothetical protein BWY59_00703 [Verrucomicrobia bacterium ADurb.Bin345]|nr:MAG: hypothetical protein BWY59_00703 [Verrucomicrobia bacterium ADurb.Bin345]